MPTTPAAPVFQWSDLAKKPTEVGDALDAAGEVTITRGEVGPFENPVIDHVQRP